MAEITVNETQFVDTEDPSRNSFDIEARLKYTETLEANGTNTVREIVMSNTSSASMAEARQELADNWDREVKQPAANLAILLPPPTPLV